MNALTGIVSSVLPLVGTTLFGPIGTAVGSGLSAALMSSEEEAQRNRLMQNEYDLSMAGAVQQHQWSIEDWERNNAYNHPAEQIKRLKEAGLNPLMADPTGGLSSLPSASTAVSAQMPSSSLAQMLNVASDLQLKQAQAENLKADTSLKNEKATTERDTRDLVKQMMQSNIELNNSTIKLNLKKENLTDAQVEEVKAATDKLTKESANLAKQFEILDQELILKQKEVNWYDKRVEMELREMASRIGLNAAQAQAAVKYAQLLGEQYNTQVQLTKGAKIQNGINALNFQITNATKDATIQIALTKGKQAEVYLDTPEWTKQVNGFTNELAPAIQLFMNYLKLGQSAAGATGSVIGMFE